MYSIYVFLYQVCISRYLRTEPVAMPLWPPPKSDMGVGFENNKINILKYQTPQDIELVQDTHI